MALRARINGLALCAGIGGIEIGLKRAMPKYKTVCFVERNAYAAAVLMARMEEKALDCAPIWDNVRTFDGKPWRKRVDIVTAGFPCQPVSLAGKRQFKDDKRWIWPSIARILEETQAPLVFLENVPGILSMGIESILSDLATLGYDARWCCVPASAVGARHTRERWFLIADIDGKRINKARKEKEVWERITNSFGHIRREDEPPMVRVVHGISDWVDRIACLGNAVVPAQAELAWRLLTA